MEQLACLFLCFSVDMIRIHVHTLAFSFLIPTVWQDSSEKSASEKYLY